MQHQQMTEQQYRAIVQQTELEPEAIPTVDQILDGITLPTTKPTNTFLTKAKALLAKQQSVNATLSALTLPKKKRWVPCPECGNPRCELGYWE